MNERDAILKAADHIDRNPSLFDFGAGYVPPAPGCPACALARIGYYLGDVIQPQLSCVSGMGMQRMWHSVSNYLGERTAGDFYDKLTCLAGGSDWKIRAPICAKAMRLYADKHFPAPPDWNQLAQQPAAEEGVCLSIE